MLFIKKGKNNRTSSIGKKIELVLLYEVKLFLILVEAI